MRTQFEKIYVVSLITNKDRQEFVKYQMDDLNLDFEFLYGIDFYNIKYDRFGKEISYPSLTDEWEHLNNSKAFGCAISHYNAVLHAYELGYKNVLVLEDDICFIKNRELIYNCLNFIPHEVDFMTYNTRFIEKEEVELFKNYQQLYNDGNDYFIKIPNTFTTLCGGMMYGLMNRQTMELYLNNQRTSFLHADHINGIFENPTVKRYSSIYAVGIDQYNRLRKGKEYDEFGVCYDQANIVVNYDDFYEPSNYNISNLNNKLEESIIEDKNKI